MPQAGQADTPFSCHAHIPRRIHHPSWDWPLRAVSAFDATRTSVDDLEKAFATICARDPFSVGAMTSTTRTARSPSWNGTARFPVELTGATRIHVLGTRGSTAAEAGSWPSTGQTYHSTTEGRRLSEHEEREGTILQVPGLPDTEPSVPTESAYSNW